MGPAHGAGRLRHRVVAISRPDPLAPPCARRPPFTLRGGWLPLFRWKSCGSGGLIVIGVAAGISAIERTDPLVLGAFCCYLSHVSRWRDRAAPSASYCMVLGMVGLMHSTARKKLSSSNCPERSGLVSGPWATLNRIFSPPRPFLRS